MHNTPNSTKNNDRTFCLGPVNYLLMAVSCLLILIGFILMSGPGCTMDHFNPEVFSPLRTVFAPTLCFLGYLLMIPAVILSSRSSDSGSVD